MSISLFLSLSVCVTFYLLIYLLINLLMCQSIKELNRTCRAMQQRVVELISRVSNEEVTEELLHVNDDLNNIFLRYERYDSIKHSLRLYLFFSQPTRADTMSEPISCRSNDDFASGGNRQYFWGSCVRIKLKICTMY